MESVLLFLLFFVSILISISSLDDAFIDIFGLAIVRLRSATINENLEIPPTAVFVANWHEADEIGKIVEGNLARRTPKLAHVPKVIVGRMGVTHKCEAATLV